MCDTLADYTADSPFSGDTCVDTSLPNGATSCTRPSSSILSNGGCAQSAVLQACDYTCKNYGETTTKCKKIKKKGNCANPEKANKCQKTCKVCAATA